MIKFYHFQLISLKKVTMNDLGINKEYQKFDFTNSINELSKISQSFNSNEKFTNLVNCSSKNKLNIKMN
jgi:hypothetical protein